MGPQNVLVGSSGKRSFNDWLPWLAGGLVIFLMVAFIALVGGVLWATNQQLAALVTKIEASESAMTTLQANVVKTYEEYPTDEAARNAALQQVARDGIASIGKASHDIVDYQPVVLDPNLIEAKQAYLKHTAAWLAYLNKAAADPAEFEKDQPDVDNTFMAVEPKLKAAIPPVPLGDIKQRINAIFTNGAPPDDGVDPNVPTVGLQASTSSFSFVGG